MMILLLTLPVSEGLFFLLKVFVSCLKKMVKGLPGLLGEDFCEQEINSSVWILPKTFTSSGFKIYLKCLFKIQVKWFLTNYVKIEETDFSE